MDPNRTTDLSRIAAATITLGALLAGLALAIFTVTSDDVLRSSASSTVIDAARATPITVEFVDPVHERSVEASFWRPVDGGRNELIVVSHGFAGDRSSLADSAALFAEAGFTVIAPTHPDLAGLESGVPALDPLVLRPRHISLAIDTAVEHNAGAFDDVTVFGHSMGGYTALRVAGADIRVGALLSEHCDSEATDEVLCSPVASPRFARAADVDGRGALDEGALDDRVTSVVLLAPAYGPLFATDDLDLDASVFVVTAHDDPLVSARQTDALVARLTDAGTSVSHDEIDGGHFVFLRPCTEVESATQPIACEGSGDRAVTHEGLIAESIDFLDTTAAR